MYKLIHGEALEEMAKLPPQSVDLIATDLPYGTTACSWDTVIPFAPMWEAVKHVLKPRGAFVTTASQPFTSALAMSNVEWFRYEWIWEKHRKTGFLDCVKKPLKAHENVLVFYSEQPTYNPQMTVGRNHKRGGASPGPAQMYGKFSDRTQTESTENYPNSVLYFNACLDFDHPTQKPVALYEYLIRTYSNPGDTVLDFCFGSGTTGVACMRTGRDFIGIERLPVVASDPDYFGIAERRIAQAAAQPPLFVEQPRRETAEQAPLFGESENMPPELLAGEAITKG